MGKDLHQIHKDRGLTTIICKELKKLVIKIPNNLILKWGTELNRILNRRISNDQKIFKELLNILSYQGNANQNFS